MNNNYITITEVNRYIKEIINEDLLLRKVYLKGEISNFKAHSRGHYYFTLKDETSRIAAVMFSFNNRNLKFTPYDGMKVLVTGKIDVYEASGSYQIYVEDMAPDGVGALYVAFEQFQLSGGGVGRERLVAPPVGVFEEGELRAGVGVFPTHDHPHPCRPFLGHLLRE